jgi:hypothetical protein
MRHSVCGVRVFLSEPCPSPALFVPFPKILKPHSNQSLTHCNSNSNSNSPAFSLSSLAAAATTATSKQPYAPPPLHIAPPMHFATLSTLVIVSAAALMHGAMPVSAIIVGLGETCGATIPTGPLDKDNVPIPLTCDVGLVCEKACRNCIGPNGVCVKIAGIATTTTTASGTKTTSTPSKPTIPAVPAVPSASPPAVPAVVPGAAPPASTETAAAKSTTNAAGAFIAPGLLGMLAVVAAAMAL